MLAPPVEPPAVGLSGARVHHVGIIAPDREQVAELCALLGLRIGLESFVPEYDADCLFTEQSGTPIEFVVPRGGPLTRFNGGVGGLHHIALGVPDLDAASEALRAAGVELLSAAPVETDLFRLNFIPPVYTRGVIVEIVEPRAGLTMEPHP
jgi:catechol 2,3-dioxygenase-like lactoylglutathione lyase family enzyme